MSRYRDINVAEMNPAQKRVHDQIVAGKRGRFGGPFQLLIRAPEICEHAAKLGEHGHGLCDPAWVDHTQFWASCQLDTTFITWYGINPHRKFSSSPWIGLVTISSASSFEGSARSRDFTRNTYQLSPSSTGACGIAPAWLCANTAAESFGACPTPGT